MSDIQKLTYSTLNPVERRIVDQWVKGGYSLEETLDLLNNDLTDAAEEDGYDGP